MPQIDQLTFNSIVFITTALYVLQYLLLSVSHMYKFISTLKLTTKRIIFIFFQNKISKKIIKTILFFP